VKKILRAKKAKSSSKPSNVVHIEPRSLSPPSLSDDVSTGKSGNTIGRKGSGGSGGGIDQCWLESEFEFLKRQNHFLEQKLDSQNKFLDAHNKFIEQKLETLLQVTLRMSPSPVPPVTKAASSSEEEFLRRKQEQGSLAGGKRRRLSPVESDDHLLPPRAPRHLLSEAEEQKLFDAGDDHDYGIYGEQKLFYDESYGIEPSPYAGDNRKMPSKMIPIGASAKRTGRNANAGVESSDSLKRFVDIMLGQEEEDEEERLAVGMNDPAQIQCNNHSAAPPPAPQPECPNIAMTLDDELMEEAMNTFLPDEAGYGANEHGGPARSSRPGSYPARLVATTNNADVKANGPHLIPAVSHEVPTAGGPGLAAATSPDGVPLARTVTPDAADVQGRGDMEEGGIAADAVGVAIIEATAELVESDGNGFHHSNNNEESLQLERDQSRRERRTHRRRALCLLASIGVAMVAGLTSLAVVVTKKSKAPPRHPPFVTHKDGAKSSSHDEGGCKKGKLCHHRPLVIKPCKEGFRQDKKGNCVVIWKKGMDHDEEGGIDDDDDLDRTEEAEEGEDPRSKVMVEDEDNLQNGTESDGNDPFDPFNADKESPMQEQRSYPGFTHHIKKKQRASLFNSLRDGSLSSLSFSVVLDGVEFGCRADQSRF